jgi:NADH:ubiquinone oxidoreductase subunit 6 (subunit J)
MLKSQILLKPYNNSAVQSSIFTVTSATLPAVSLYTVLAVPLVLLSFPTLVVGVWVTDHAFFSATAFGWDAFGELALPLGACICAAIVFLCRNPMHALLALLGVFFSTVVMYLIAGIAFVGLVFLIVYVGAVAVLFLFVIMLLNVKSLTSEERLIQHPTQVAAILATIVLLQQLHARVMSAVDSSISDNFLRDASVEPTTGSAVFRYVRFQAMDINTLTSLYTLHSILLLVTTGILLAALLGAIILATVTTERATSTYDIHTYSEVSNLSLVSTVVAGALVFFSHSLVDFVMQVVGWLEYLSQLDLWGALVLMSYPYCRVTDEKRFLITNYRKSQRAAKLLNDSRYRLSAQQKWYCRRFPRPRLRVGLKVRRRAFCRQLTEIAYVKYASKKFPYSVTLKRMLRAPTSVSSARRALQQPRIFRFYAVAALAPIAQKFTTKANLGTIVRRRWLWHWRRDRAISLFRVDSDVGVKFKLSLFRRLRRWLWVRLVWYPAHCVYVIIRNILWTPLRLVYSYPAREMPEVIKAAARQKLAAFNLKHNRRLVPSKRNMRIMRARLTRRLGLGLGPWIHHKPAFLRFRSLPVFYNRDTMLTIKRKAVVWLPRVRFQWSPLRYLRFMYLTNVAPTIQYAAWRLRSFATFFVFYVFVISILSAFAHLFVEDYWDIWREFCFVYQRLQTELYLAAPNISEGGAAVWIISLLLMPFVSFIVWVGQHGLIITILAIAMAHDAVLMHGGELSDIEFQEARCVYWRVEGLLHQKRREAKNAAAALVRARRHPDKGHTDSAYPYWVYKLQAELPSWAMRYVFDAVDYFYLYLHYFHQTQVYRCLSPWFRSMPPAFNKKYPFVLEWYFAARQALVDARIFAWNTWCQEIWQPVSSWFSSIIYHSQTIEYYIRISGWGGLTPVLYGIFGVGVLYAVSCVLVRLNWARMYYGLPIRKPSLLVYVFLLFLTIYAFGTFYQRYAMPTHQVLNVRNLQKSFDLFATYRIAHEHDFKFEYWADFQSAWFNVKRLLMYFPAYAVFSLYSKIEQPGYRDEAIFYSPRRLDFVTGPVILRMYFNLWAAWHKDFYSYSQVRLAAELAPFASIVEASAHATAEAKQVKLDRLRAQQDKLFHDNIVQHTFIPKFYCFPFTRKEIRTDPNRGAFVSGAHPLNSFYSK